MGSKLNSGFAQILVVVLFLIGIVSLGTYFWTTQKVKSNPSLLTPSPTSTPNSTINQLGDAKTKEECQEKDGVWQRWGLLGLEYCQIPVFDADKSCTGGSQCSLGKCISQGSEVPGKCQKFRNVFGCFSFVEAGKAGPALCVD